jgi:hypothetical protein
MVGAVTFPAEQVGEPAFEFTNYGRGEAGGGTVELGGGLSVDSSRENDGRGEKRKCGSFRLQRGQVKGRV